MINILDLGFLSLAVMVTFTGFVIKHYEKHVPDFVIKSFKYGSFAYQGSGANYLQIIEVPKALYRHFYAFSSVFSTVVLVYAIAVYYFECSVHKYVVIILKLLLEQDEPAVSVAAVILALSLLTLQCLRRCYETYYIQVFAKSSKMNLSHYVAGLVHYFAVVVAAIGQGPLFCGSQKRETILWTDTKTILLSVPVTVVFLCAWYEQYKTNIILANMRKDKKTGQLVTEAHSVPHGRLFEYVSSPHRLCEVIMYVMLLILIPTRTFFCIFLWVISNQFKKKMSSLVSTMLVIVSASLLGAVSEPSIFLWVQTSVHAHDWYKMTFKNYPENRTPMIPDLAFIK